MCWFHTDFSCTVKVASRAASMSAALSVAGCAMKPVGAAPTTDGSLLKPRITCTALPCANRLLCQPRITSGQSSLIPGAWMPTECPRPMKHCASLRVIQCRTRSDRRLTITSVYSANQSEL